MIHTKLNEKIIISIEKKIDIDELNDLRILQGERLRRALQSPHWTLCLLRASTRPGRNRASPDC